jgi:hypothetical protein
VQEQKFKRKQRSTAPISELPDVSFEIPDDDPLFPPTDLRVIEEYYESKKAMH